MDNRRKLPQWMTYANVMSTIAAFGVVAGGSAYAAATIGTRSIRNGAVTSAKIHRGAVTKTKLASGAVSTAALHDRSVTAAKLAAGAVGAAQIAPGSVGAAALAPGAVPPPFTLGSGAITEANLAAGAVSTPKLADGTVTTSKLAPGSVGFTQLANGSVGAVQLAPGSVGASALAAGIPHDITIVANGAGNTSDNKSVEVHCPAGEVPIGGGAAAPTTGATGFVVVSASEPVYTNPPQGAFRADFNGWVANAIEVNGGSAQVWGMEATVICARF
jgi:hypothetical protein